MVLGELGALLTSEMPPDALPVVVGVNCTLKVLDCPAGRVSGNVGPLMLKPAPAKLPWAMVKLALPELVKVRVCTPVLPTSTLPKLTLGGATESIRRPPISPRVPVTALFRSLLTSEMLPDTLPVAVGANCTLKVLDCPGGRMSGKLSPLMLKPGPVAPPRETVRLTLPVLLKLTACVLLLPTVTFPKATLAGLALSCPFPWGVVFLPATPPHPLTENQENRARMSRRLLARRKLLSLQLSGTWRWA